MNNYQVQQLNNTIAFATSIMALGFVVGMVRSLTKGLLFEGQHQSNPSEITIAQPKLVIGKELQSTFKTRTIHYDDFNISFGPHGNEIEKGELSRHPEYGTSMSLDGAYLDYTAFKPGISLLFPLEPETDLPKFYLNPFGQYTGHRYMLDSPTFIRECEVKYPDILYTKNCIGVVIHIGHKEIDRDLERAKERWAKPSPETPEERRAEFARSLTEKSKWYAKYAHEIVSYIEQHFRVLPEMPITNFRLMVRRVTPQVLDYRTGPTYPTISKDLLQWRKWFDGLVKISEPYHRAVAKAYGLSYKSITEFTWEHIVGWVEK